MVLLAALGLASFLIVSCLLGARLVLLSRRTHELPELAMGLAFLLCGGIGYGQVVIGRLVYPTRPYLTPIFLGSGYLMVDLGAICLLLFTWWVFRRNTLGRLLLAGATATILTAYVGQALVDGFAEARISGGFTWFGLVGLGFAFVWPAFESLRYHAMLRRRARIGLADPELMRRFLWWGVGAGSASLIFLTFAVLGWRDVNDVMAPEAAVPTAVFGGFAAFAIGRAFAPARRRRAARPHPDAPDG